MFSVIILGGGSGQRMGLGYNKVLYKIKGLTVIEHAVQKFLIDPDFKEIIVVINRKDYDQVHVILNHPKIKVIKGGKTRQESVLLGLNQVKDCDYVFIHDGARPNVSSKSLDKLKREVKNHGGVILYNQVSDSVIEFKDSEITSYLDRNCIGFVKTPQAFQTDLIVKAYAKAFKHNRDYKDDGSLFKQELSLDVFLVEDEADNIKLTTKFDLSIMEELL